MFKVIYSQLKPLLINHKNIILSKGYTIYKKDINSEITQLGKLKNSWLKQILANNNFIAKILRLGFHILTELDNVGYIGFVKGYIVLLPYDKKRFIYIKKIQNGSRPLNICKGEKGELLFGEYFGNEKRIPVNIYSTKDGYNWEIIYTFPRNTIRHIHNIVYDNYQKRYLILTGDNNEECGIYSTSDNFNTITPLLIGKQKYRAVSIIPTKQGLIIPTDTPIEKNYIYFYCYKDKSYNKLIEIKGSSFHAIKIQKVYIVSTIVEKSAINKSKYANLYGSTNGFDWFKIKEFHAKPYPPALLKYFRYPEMAILNGNYNENYFLSFGRSLKKFENKTLLWNIDEIVDYLNEKAE